VDPSIELQALRPPVLAAGDRRGANERLYDVLERVPATPAWALTTPLPAVHPLAGRGHAPRSPDSTLIRATKRRTFEARFLAARYLEEAYMARKQSLFATTLVVALALVAAACGSSSKKSNAAGATTTTAAANAGVSCTGTNNTQSGQLVLGALLPQSGDLKVIYKALCTPVQMAVDEINAAGGVNGKPVRLVFADDGTSPDVASTSLSTLVQSDHVNAILGPASSTTALGILDKIKSAGVVDCSGSNTSAQLSQPGGAAGGFYFRTAPPDKLQGPALAQLIVSDNKHKVAILTRNDSYGTGFGSALQSALTQSGATVVANDAYDPSASDFHADVAKIANKGADAVVVIGFNDDGAKVIKEMIAQNIGPKQVQIYTADGMQSSSLGKTIDPANPGIVNGIKGTAPAAAPSGVTNPFIAKYKATGNDTIFSSYYYDCTNLIALAAAAAGSNDPAKIRDNMIAVSKNGSLCDNYATCLPLLKQGQNINYNGASGPVDLNNDHEPSNGVYDVWAYDKTGAYANITGVPQIKING
jgi:branched-chain amino acid transport system substrate-binding protein